MRSGVDHSDATIAGTAPSFDGSSERGSLRRHRGELIGRYLLVERLGRGGMGEVWSAYDPELDRKLALKLLLLETEAGRTRLLREAQALARLTHPNVVTIHDVGSEDDQVWIAMELVDGQTLREWLRERPRSWREVRSIMVEAGRGLAAAHAKGLIHRDFKPDNVMIDREGRVRVMDFGLVRSDETPEDEGEGEGEGEPEHGVAMQLPSASDSAVPYPIIEVDEEISKPLDTDITRGGKIMGTPAYMAPEQHLGLSTDARTDQFGFCVTLWEALYRQRPFAGTSLATLALSVCEGKLSDPPRGADVPMWLRRVVERGLAINPDHRWASMDALLEVLDRDPRRRARIWLAGGLSLAFAAGIWAKFELDERRAHAACVEAGARVAQVWNPEVAAELEAAFAATGSETAGETWARTRDILAAWAGDWSALREHSCDSPTMDAELREAADACFAEGELALAQLVEALAGIDRLSLHQAVLSAQALPQPEFCVDPERLTNRQALPLDVDERTRQQELRAAIHRAAILRGLGRHEQARALAERSRAQASSREQAQLEAAAELELGRALLALGEYAAAEAVLEQSFLRAAELGDDTLMAGAAIALARDVGDRQARYDEGLRWGRIARVHVDRARLRGSPVEGELDTHLGRIHRLAGHYDEATAALERARATYEQTLGPTHPRVADVLNNLANLATDHAEYARSMELLEAAKLIYEQALGPNHPKVATVLNNMGNSLRQSGDKAGALEAYGRSLALREQAFGPDHPDVATALNNYGVGLLALRRYDEALPLYERALAIRETSLGPEHPRVASTLTNLAHCYRERDELDRARAVSERALEIRRRTLEPEHPRIAVTLISLGRVHERAQDHAAAAAAYAEALAIYERNFGPEDHRYLDALRRSGRVEGLRGDFDAAEARLLRAQELEKGRADRSFVALAKIEQQLGVVDEARGWEDAALIHYQSALQLLDDHGQAGIERSRLRLRTARLLAVREPERARELGAEALDDLERSNEDPNEVAELSGEIQGWLASWGP